MNVACASLGLLLACSDEPEDLMGGPGGDDRLLVDVPAPERQALCSAIRRRYDQVYMELEEEACLAFAQDAVLDEMDPAVREELCLAAEAECAIDEGACLIDRMLPTGCTARLSDLQRCIDDDLQQTRTALATFTGSSCSSAPGNLDLLFAVTPSCMAFLAICPLQGG